MCYTCSPTCDNCYPKMVKCTRCEAVCMLGWAACPECGEPITDEMRRRAEADWHDGVRLGTNARDARKDASGPPPGYRVDLSKLKKPQ